MNEVALQSGDVRRKVSSSAGLLHGERAVCQVETDASPATGLQDDLGATRQTGRFEPDFEGNIGQSTRTSIQIAERAETEQSALGTRVGVRIPRRRGRVGRRSAREGPGVSDSDTVGDHGIPRDRGIEFEIRVGRVRSLVGNDVVRSIIVRGVPASLGTENHGRDASEGRVVGGQVRERIDTADIGDEDRFSPDRSRNGQVVRFAGLAVHGRTEGDRAGALRLYRGIRIDQNCVSEECATVAGDRHHSPIDHRGPVDIGRKAGQCDVSTDRSCEGSRASVEAADYDAAAESALTVERVAESHVIPGEGDVADIHRHVVGLVAGSDHGHGLLLQHERCCRFRPAEGLAVVAEHRDFALEGIRRKNLSRIAIGFGSGVIPIDICSPDGGVTSTDPHTIGSDPVVEIQTEGRADFLAVHVEEDTVLPAATGIPVVNGNYLEELVLGTGGKRVVDSADLVRIGRSAFRDEGKHVVVEDDG